jgi:hypothetical protein
MDNLQEFSRRLQKQSAESARTSNVAESALSTHILLIVHWLEQDFSGTKLC